MEQVHLFNHLIYEYKKGLRNLVLLTSVPQDRVPIEKRLIRNGISYRIHQVNGHKINVFFGSPECVAVVESFGGKDLCQLNDEEDFILGTLLGYDKQKQCQRYLKRKGNPNAGNLKISHHC
ncbi:MAG: DUF2023 family protein [Chitinispirillaceae bacterium]